MRKLQASVFLATLSLVRTTLMSALQSLQADDASSALSRARSLQPPAAQVSYSGELENSEWWEENNNLIEAALAEWGPLHPELYHLDDYFRHQFLEPDLVRAVSTRDKKLFGTLFERTSAKGVYTLRFFTNKFVSWLLEELNHYELSGVPLRRPNGMNRYGAILSQLSFEELVNNLVEDYLLPISHHLFPNFIAPDDLRRNYPFVVRYGPDQDTHLAEHTDASTVTVNICLQPPEEPASTLYFKGNRFLDRADENEPTFVALHEPGRAVVHLGQQLHGVQNVTSIRSNMVVWMFGEHGYVRIAPYEEDEVRSHRQEYDQFWNSRQPEL